MTHKLLNTLGLIVSKSNTDCTSSSMLPRCIFSVHFGCHPSLNAFTAAMSPLYSDYRVSTSLTQVPARCVNGDPCEELRVVAYEDVHMARMYKAGNPNSSAAFWSLGQTLTSVESTSPCL
jgi:hypothetical protein